MTFFDLGDQRATMCYGDPESLIRPEETLHATLFRLAAAVGALQGVVAAMQYNPQRGEPAGFFDLPAHDHCPHPQHSPAYGIYVPPGKGYRHVCPGCGFSFVILG